MGESDLVQDISAYKWERNIDHNFHKIFPGVSQNFIVEMFNCQVWHICHFKKFIESIYTNLRNCWVHVLEIIQNICVLYQRYSIKIRPKGLTDMISNNNYWWNNGLTLNHWTCCSGALPCCWNWNPPWINTTEKTLLEKIDSPTLLLKSCVMSSYFK